MRKKSFRWNLPEVRAMLVVVAATIVLVAWAWYSIPVTADEPGHAEGSAGIEAPITPILHGVIQPIDRGGILYQVEEVQPAPVQQVAEKESFPVAEPVPPCTDAIADAGGICKGEPLPACATEDSTGCVWDASEQGNGQGHDIIDGRKVIYDENDMVIFEDGTWHDYITGYDGCMEGFACDSSGNYTVYPEQPRDASLVCWGNLLGTWTCLNPGVQP